MEAQSEKVVPFFIRITQFIFHHIKLISIMAEKTSEELDRELKERGYQQDKTDPNRYDRPGQAGGTEKVWTDGGYSRTEDDSTYRKNR